ncbi:MAG: thioredoxin [Bacteroidia bacterium]
MATFNELINSEQPVLVDFYVEWCEPCKMMAPVLKEVISKLNGKAKILKVDVDKNRSAAEKYGIRSVPTLIIFKKGQIKWQQAGVVPGHQLVKALEMFIN